jgi:hypothetical protein
MNSLEIRGWLFVVAVLVVGANVTAGVLYYKQLQGSEEVGDNGGSTNGAGTPAPVVKAPDGTPLVPVPYVKGMYLDQAKAALDAKKLKIKWLGNPEVGPAERQEPAANMYLKPGQEVAVTFPEAKWDGDLLVVLFVTDEVNPGDPALKDALAEARKWPALKTRLLGSRVHLLYPGGDKTKRFPCENVKETFDAGFAEIEKVAMNPSVKEGFKTILIWKTSIDFEFFGGPDVEVPKDKSGQDRKINVICWKANPNLKESTTLNDKFYPVQYPTSLEATCNAVSFLVGGKTEP